ncbi:hypothetical protein [Moraxella ovis]|uniref:hypothetical protein n=1 Tax=Moraxella ovis TaxID=29433 RepID=UPI000D8592D7|nr:hypothetical protein [Moraxella ovis]SPX84323.1 Uncharacterised protein [Moraxella ovis]
MTTIHATGKAQTVVNKGATIESAGQMQVDTKTLLNTNADFKKHTVKVDAESVYGQTLTALTNKLPPSPPPKKALMLLIWVKSQWQVYLTALKAVSVLSIMITTPPSGHT